MSDTHRYALGCAFSLGNLFDNFPLKKLKTTCKQCKELFNDEHRHRLTERIFKECYKIVIDDIITNNVTFWLPLNGVPRCKMNVRRFSGDELKIKRQLGLLKDLDIFKSNFTGACITFYMYRKGTPRTKTVYIDKKHINELVNNINNGMQYGDSKYDKKINDYYEQMYSLFPSISKQDIKRILKFGWRSLYLHNSYGGDTLIRDNKFWSYIGNLRSDPLVHFRYYVRKLAIKLRVLYRRKKLEWDGYYYFALTDNQYDKYLSQIKKKGRRRKYFEFGPVMVYQIFDECRICEHGKKYIFRIPYISRIKSKFFVQNLVTDKAELILIRNALKFSDIQTLTNEYEFL